jgi:RHS repeat-associated protein
MISAVTSAKSMESWTYTYDDLNRLLAAANVDTPGLSQSFTYDDVGNMTYNSAIGSYTYPTPGTVRPHAVQTAGSRSYAYDAAGRMTSRNGQVIQWNGDGKPSSIGSVAYTYGGTGERLKKVSGSQVTRYVGGNYEIAPNGTITKYLVGGKQVGTDFFINHSDHLGSIQAVTNAAGVEVRRQAHTPFGDQHYATGSHAESKGWIGEREEETELLYLNARYHDPEIGRFISPDPFAFAGQGLNRYSYALNTPVNASDPSGLYVCYECAEDSGGWGGGWGGIIITIGDFLSGGPPSPNTDAEPSPGLPAPPTPSPTPAPSPPPEPVPAPPCAYGDCAWNQPIDYGPTECPRCHFDNPYQPASRGGRSGELEAAIVHGFVPVLGEAADLGIVLSPDSTTTDRVIAGGSLTINLLTAGLLPNFGSFTKSTRLLGPGTRFGEKILDQLASRGWTKRLVQRTIDDPAFSFPWRDTRHLKGGAVLDDPATVFYSKRGGYVVRNDRTGDIVQISDRLDPNWKTPW